METNRSRLKSAVPAHWSAGTVAVLAVLLNTGPVMSQQCPLSSPLVVKDLQDGFAGQTGSIWTVGVDCTISVARQVGEKVGEPFYRGRLSVEQETELRNVLARTSPADLPARAGTGGPPVNARHVIVALGPKVSTVTLAPGGDLGAARAAAGDQSSGRLIELAQTVMNLHSETAN
jgi:hypothetical protein